MEDINRIKTFGYRGEALHSIISLSEKFEIVSRKSNVSKLIRKTIKKFSEAKQLAALEYLNSSIFAKGSQIIISNLFYNAPIKQEQFNEFEEWKSIRIFLEQISLYFYDISIEVIDLHENKTLYQAYKSKNMKIKFENLFGTDFRNYLKPYKLEDKDFLNSKSDSKSLIQNINVQGLFSIYSHNASLQFIYLNKYLIENSSFYSFLNKCLSVVNMCSKKKVNYKYPVYVILMSCPQEYFCLNENKNNRNAFFIDNDYVMFLLQKLVDKFLIAEGFRLPSSKSNQNSRSLDKSDETTFNENKLTAMKNPEDAIWTTQIKTSQKRKLKEENDNQSDKKLLKQTKARADHCSWHDLSGGINPEKVKTNDLILEEKSDAKIEETMTSVDINNISEIVKVHDTSCVFEVLDSSYCEFPKHKQESHQANRRTEQEVQCVADSQDFNKEKRSTGIWDSFFSSYEPRSKMSRYKCSDSNEFEKQDFHVIDNLLIENQSDNKWRSRIDRSGFRFIKKFYEIFFYSIYIIVQSIRNASSKTHNNNAIASQIKLDKSIFKNIEVIKFKKPNKFPLLLHSLTLIQIDYTLCLYVF